GEQFMGAKLFAWIGGLALFLGVAFFVKYSFEHNLIPPELRVAIGFVVGLSLLVGGVLLKREENAVTAQTLCATGILVLYTVTFACRSYYHFAFFGLIPTLLLMTLITAVAFLLAVRLSAIVVAILGLAAVAWAKRTGKMNRELSSSALGLATVAVFSAFYLLPFQTLGQRPALLFSYIFLVDLGLLALTLLDAKLVVVEALAGLAAFIF